MAENIRVYWNELASNKLASSCADFLFGKEKPKKIPAFTDLEEGSKKG